MQLDNSVYDVIESLQAAPDQPAVLKIMRRVVKDNGYSYFMIAGISRPIVNAERFILAEDWPP